MAKWKFGVNQSNSAEKKEIRKAQAAGRVEEYMRAQAMQRMREAGPRLIEAETARRRAKKLAPIDQQQAA